LSVDFSQHCKQFDTCGNTLIGISIKRDPSTSLCPWIALVARIGSTEV
jgi:hypothetical protein